MDETQTMTLRAREPEIGPAVFRRLPAGAVPGMQFRLLVGGAIFTDRSAQLMAKVGDQWVADIVPYPGGGGFGGLLAREPNDGDRLAISYDSPELQPTNIVYRREPGQVA